MKSMATVSFFILIIAAINTLEGRSTEFSDNSDACDTVRCRGGTVCKVINNQVMCVEIDDSSPVPASVMCQDTKDCQDDENCSRGKCVKICNGVCGSNAECKVVNYRPVCKCPENYIGDPFVACRLKRECDKKKDGECHDNNDCVDSQACIKNRCGNPCLEKGVCGEGAECFVKFHLAACSCRLEYRGNPYEKCTYFKEDSKNVSYDEQIGL